MLLFGLSLLHNKVEATTWNGVQKQIPEQVSVQEPGGEAE
jgi:hypothetical protein